VQQSPSVVQISPSARHESCVAHRPPVAVGKHKPLQQLPCDEHASPSTAQLGPALAQVPPVQRFEQHSAFEEHDAPIMAQLAVSLQNPPTHPVEQQSAAVTQAVPATAQPPGT
jgi:hypothetical protein